ncbi:MAG: hypothetical protein M3P06_05370 [Acidobacteriota bacterium]|nr:hypothetical protein [Acidobacteriota bacterium]
MDERVDAVVRARRAASSSLLKALLALPAQFSEADLALRWLSEIKHDPLIRESGWYVPPPNGMSVLIGNPPDYGRLRYNSLREPHNWPNTDVRYSEDSVLYPYFSAVDRETFLIGDFVGTFYGGPDPAIRAWIAAAYKITMDIAAFIQPGQRVSDIFNFAAESFAALGAANNTYSQSGGLASDIGHTIPWFDCDATPLQGNDQNDTDVAKLIANARSFVSRDNHTVLSETFGLTIEPQLVAPGLPMASFHIIVLVANGRKTVVTEFGALFEHFGMTELHTSNDGDSTGLTWVSPLRNTLRRYFQRAARGLRQVRTVTTELLFPGTFSAQMGRIVAALSIIALVYHSLHLGLSNTLRLCLEYYDAAIGAAFRIVDPHIGRLLRYLSQYVNVKITVWATWHHVFVVMWMLLVRDAGVAFSDGRRTVGTARLFAGVCVAALFSVLASVDLGLRSSIVQNLQLATLPYVGIYVYDLVMYGFAAAAPRRYWQNDWRLETPPLSRWTHFKRNAVRAHVRVGLILGAVALCLAIPLVFTMPFPRGGMIALAVATSVNLAYWVVRGFGAALKMRHAGETTHESLRILYRRSEAGRFSLAVGSVLAWVLTFILLNTGAKLLGL